MLILKAIVDSSHQGFCRKSVSISKLALQTAVMKLTLLSISSLALVPLLARFHVVRLRIHGIHRCQMFTGYDFIHLTFLPMC